MIGMAIFGLIFGVLNRARGSKLFGYTDFTMEARVMSTFLMGFFAALLMLFHSPEEFGRTMAMMGWVWGSLLLWCIPGWDTYWSAAIGDDPDHSRGWGLDMLTLRMALAAPCIAGTACIASNPYHACLAIGTLFLGLPYVISGYIAPRKYVIAAPEVTVGGIIGMLIYGAITGV